ncbi:hotdog fold thioesterase [Roseicella aquatilis]|uniref:Hotdog fold thioesterase n=1 Tax=Roseicella aquatilis TaxID=2527868 RepID=A0A4R4DSB0_9PROT|nr:hotdog fold thioesterase [Roseicella aquatilis]TCZ64458.1 hotdog fold thioesterase [Roseicella aquatilis]
MGIWKRTVPPETLSEQHGGTLPALLDIRFVEFGEDFARATMPVDERHIQPAGILHGGASVVLAETIGSVCGVMALEEGWTVVGLEVNANHLAPVFKGDAVEALCRPLQLGRSVQVWTIEMRRGDGRLTCVSRLTTVVRQVRGD